MAAIAKSNFNPIKRSDDFHDLILLFQILRGCSKMPAQREWSTGRCEKVPRDRGRQAGEENCSTRSPNAQG